MGGVASAFMALANFLEEKGFLIQVLLPYSTDIETAVISRKYIIGAVFKKRITNTFLKRALNLFNLLTGWNFYFLFAIRNKWPSDIFAIYHGLSYSHWIKFSRSNRNLIWLHGEVEHPTNFLWRKSISRNYNRYDALIAITDKLVSGWKEVYAIKKDFFVINNLIDVNEIIRKSNDKQEEIISDEYSKILCVSRLSKEKGIFRLLNAAKNYFEKGYKFVLYFVGDGPLKHDMNRFILENDLGACCRLLGTKQNPFPYMKAADALILASYTEGSPMVIWEALLVGCPVLATRCGGVADALHNGAWGMVVENNDNSFFEGFEYLLKNYSTLRKKIDFDDFLKHIRCLNEKSQKSLLDMLS